jgi:sugar phosphate isomerase/epimerase
MRIFATLYFRDIEKRDSHFKLLQRLGYLPEIYFESGWSRHDEARHRELAAIVKGELGGCSVHLPYRDILPGGGNKAAADTLARAAALADLYGPAHLVGHACFRPRTDSQNAPLKHLGMSRAELSGPAATPSQEFLKNSIKAWTGVLDATGAKLFLENTNERSPFPIQELLKGLPEDRASMCLDVGHWHYSGMGESFKNLPEWIDMCAPRLGHLHIHDNDGSADQHLSIGKGRIDFGLLWSLLRRHGLDPSATVENQTPWELETSSQYLEGHPF